MVATRIQGLAAASQGTVLLADRIAASSHGAFMKLLDANCWPLVLKFGGEVDWLVLKGTAQPMRCWRYLLSLVAK